MSSLLLFKKNREKEKAQFKDDCIIKWKLVANIVYSINIENGIQKTQYK